MLQYIMGHANIAVTMEVYNHITEYARIEKEILKMEVPGVLLRNGFIPSYENTSSRLWIPAAASPHMILLLSAMLNFIILVSI